MDIIELDPEIVSVAEKFFGFTVNERVKVEVCDGIEYVKNAYQAGKKGES